MEPSPTHSPGPPLRGLLRAVVATAVLAAVLGGGALVAKRATPHARARASPHADARLLRATATGAPAHARKEERAHAEEKASVPAPESGRVAGIVVDEAGAPVEATVVAIRCRVPMQPAQAVRTGRNGRFEMTLEAKWWDLHAETRDALSRPGELHLDEGDHSAEVKLVVHTPAPIEGSVYDPDGRPCPGACVLADSYEDEIRAQGGMACVITSSGIPRGICAQASTDENGRYSMRVPPGKVSLHAQTKTAASEVRTATVDDMHGAEVDLYLQAHTVIEGRITDTAGRAIVGAEVRDPEGALDASQFVEYPDAATDREGRYRLELPWRCSRRGLYVTAEGYLPGMGDFDRSEASDFDFVLQRAPTLRGFVRLPDGSPAAGAAVAQTEPGRDHGELAIWAPSIPDHVAAADGSFEIKQAWIHPSVVEAYLQGYAASESAPFEVAEGATVEGIVVVLCRGACLHGRVLDAGTFAPLGGARVYQYYRSAGSSGWRQYSVDRDGSFRIPNVPPGHCRFGIDCEGHGSQKLELDLAEGQDLERDVLLDLPRK